MYDMLSQKQGGSTGQGASWSLLYTHSAGPLNGYGFLDMTGLGKVSRNASNVHVQRSLEIGKSKNVMHPLSLVNTVYSRSGGGAYLKCPCIITVQNFHRPILTLFGYFAALGYM